MNFVVAIALVWVAALAGIIFGIRALGNAVVPQVAELIGRRLPA